VGQAGGAVAPTGPAGRVDHDHQAAKADHDRSSPDDHDVGTAAGHDHDDTRPDQHIHHRTIDVNHLVHHHHHHHHNDGTGLDDDHHDRAVGGRPPFSWPGPLSIARMAAVPRESMTT
jgi:hypothetical protein